MVSMLLVFFLHFSIYTILFRVIFPCNLFLNLVVYVISGRRLNGFAFAEDKFLHPGHSYESHEFSPWKYVRGNKVIDLELLPEVYAKKQVVVAFRIALNFIELDPEMRPRMQTVLESLDCIKSQRRK